MSSGRQTSSSSSPYIRYPYIVVVVRTDSSSSDRRCQLSTVPVDIIHPVNSPIPLSLPDIIIGTVGRLVIIRRRHRRLYRTPYRPYIPIRTVPSSTSSVPSYRRTRARTARTVGSARSSDAVVSRRRTDVVVRRPRNTDAVNKTTPRPSRLSPSLSHHHWSPSPRSSCRHRHRSSYRPYTDCHTVVPYAQQQQHQHQSSSTDDVRRQQQHQHRHHVRPYLTTVPYSLDRTSPYIIIHQTVCRHQSTYRTASSSPIVVVVVTRPTVLSVVPYRTTSSVHHRTVHHRHRHVIIT